MFSSLTEKHPKKTIAVLSVIALIVIVMSFRAYNSTRDAEDPGSQGTATEASVVEPTDEETTSDTINNGTDKLIARVQEDLVAEYGTPPKGFVWDRNGKPISLGIKDMTSDDVVYTYIRSLSTLDMGIAQKLSREASVVETYSEYFDSTGNTGKRDYNDEYNRESYRAAMLSIQNNGIQDGSVFAENRRVYTVNASVIDLTDKEFWVKDKDKLFNQIYQYDEVQGDSEKADTYVNGYILEYYKSDKVKRRDVQFTVTAERYPDLNTGWLVSIDDDLNKILKNENSTPVNRHIMSQYSRYKQERLQKEREAAKGGV